MRSAPIGGHSTRAVRGFRNLDDLNVASLVWFSRTRPPATRFPLWIASTA
jgi:hypothetical protein